MESFDDLSNSIHALIQSGQKENIDLALTIADGLGLTDKILAPWRRLKKLVYRYPIDIVYAIYELTNMDEIDLSYRKLQVFPPDFVYLKQLTEIDLSDNNITSLPENIGALTQLRKIHLRGNALRTLPESIGQLTHLKELNLIQNQIEALPNSFGELQQLEFLFLGSNQLRHFPTSLKKLNNLQSLDLSSNPMRVRSYHFANFQQLRKLYTRGVGLSIAPPTMLAANCIPIFDEDGSISEIGGPKGWITQNYACWYYDCYCLFRQTYPCKYRGIWSREEDEPDSFTPNDLLEDSFHQSPKYYKAKRKFGHCTGKIA